jgi:HD-like signal output (HDOD) protein
MHFLQAGMKFSISIAALRTLIRMLNFIEPTLLEKLRSERALPSPQGVRLTIMRMCAEENPNMAELIRLVQADPALSGRIIRILNLTNAGRVRACAAVGTEVLLLVGLQSIRQLALALSLAEGGNQAECVGFDFNAFWSRSFAMAAAAQAIADRTRIAPLAEMFTTGLLANIGKLALASMRSSAYSSLLQHRLPGSVQLTMEQSLFGFNHLNLAAALMLDWQIPLLFCNAVLHHESPQTDDHDVDARQQKIAWTLNLAGAIADIGIGAQPTAAGDAMERARDAIERLGVSWADFLLIYEKTGLDWREWADGMGFGKGMLWIAVADDDNPSASTADDAAA